MTGSNQIDYQSLNQKVGKTNDWQSSTEELRSHPQYPEQATQAVEQAYSKLDPQTQQALDQMPPDAKTSFFHLVGTVSQMSQQNKQQSQQIGQFITQAIQQAASTSGSSR